MPDLEQMGLFETAPAGPPGFEYHSGFLSEGEQARLVRRVAELPFAPFEFHGFQGKRRTISFGWAYAFDGSGAISATDPIPDFLLQIRERASRLIGAELASFEHMLVTEYGPGAGIGWHRDRSVFGRTIAVSLLAPCRLRFRRRIGSNWERKSITAEPRSLYLLAGA